MTSTIYKIYCRDNKITDCYVGSTDDFDVRCRYHNSSCHNENYHNYNYKVYKFIREHGGMSCWIIEEIINCDEDNRYDLEVHYYKLLNSTLNTYYPRRTKKEYQLDNKKEILIYQNQYRENNKDYYKDYSKQYHLNNREKLLEKQKQYYLNNKKTLTEKKRIKFVCDCGSVVNKSDKSQHYKSQKHIRYLETIK
jgi:hypothetical protein